MIDDNNVVIDKTGSSFSIGHLKYNDKKLPYLKDNTLIVFADGVDNFLNMVLTEMKTAKRGKSSIRERDDEEFNTFDSYEEAMDTFLNKPETIVEFDPTELRIKDVDESGNTVEFDVTGDFIDVGRYLEGIPEVVGTMHNGNARNRRANIIINLNAIHHISQAAILHRGERVLRLVDALEANGVRTSLIGIDSNDCQHIEITVKRHEEPLTVTDLAVLIHPDFLRRTLFRTAEYSNTWDYGYGNAVIFSDNMSPDKIEGDNINELNIFVDSNFRDKREVDDVFDKLEKLIVWEFGKAVPEVTSIKASRDGIFFKPNGARSNDDISREGREVMVAES